MARSAQKTTMSKQVKKPNLNDFLDEIKLRAFEIYNKRMRNNEAGDELHDWLKAEAEIKVKYNISK
jgi:hypothetical protein